MKRFVFENYEFDKNQKTAKFFYSYESGPSFTESYKFDFEFVDFDFETLDKALQSLFFMAGVSYFKAYLPDEIKVNKGVLDKESARFFAKTYQKGLGEFFYVNNLDPSTPINFPSSSRPSVASSFPSNEGLLIGIGGGKDSLLSTEFLCSQPKVATWSVGHRQQLEPLVSTIGLPHLWVERSLDQPLLALNKKGAYNGHIPISAIFACVGTVVAILSGYRDIVVSNESSASEPSLTYKNIEINHQYSKSIEFEQDFQGYLKHLFEGKIRYYSFLRPLSEVRIAELFAPSGFEKYKDVFSSCNRAFTQERTSMFWCGECPKCAFTFLILTPFIEQKKLEALFTGKNLLLDSSLEPTYRQLLGIEGDRPLECVGDVKESRTAMKLAQEQYPRLTKYKFKLPESYDYKSLSSHSMPQEIYNILQSSLKNPPQEHTQDKVVSQN